ncbi:MAG TPA: aminotransferase class V-fold PLP-dependent enzyme [Gaiellaceae bacterium]|nr:aminotransferase class V-fold PLP-dependent enzyme [Gaiellaceae bacterium]
MPGQGSNEHPTGQTPRLTPGLSVRAEFPIFEHTTYANSCSQGALANRVRAAAEEWLAGWDENGAEWPFWVERNEAARTAFATLVHAQPDDVAVTTSVSQGVSALVSALDLTGERKRIVVSEYEFPTVGQIAHAQELRGAEVVHVRPEDDGRIPLERFADAIDERTALVCCTAVSFRSGHRHDVSAIAELAHASGAILLADSYQAIGSMEIDVRAIGADVITGGTVKYLLGSAGLAFMWLRPELRSQLLPTQTGWFADEDIFAMSIADYSPHASARRFDSGTPPVPSLYPGVAGMDLISEVGVPAIEEHVRGLNDRLLAGLDDLGARVMTPRAANEHGALICVLSTDPDALVDALAAERIVTSTRDSNLRISLHLYNVEEDVDRIVAALAANRVLLA